jgi:hypothetical protein
MYQMHLKIDPKGRTMKTRTTELTEGLADLKEPRRSAMDNLRRKLRSEDVSDDDEMKGELCAPWDQGNLNPAVSLALEYYKTAKELGLYNNPNKWSARPLGM